MKTFMSLNHLMDYIKTTTGIYYKAPMDLKPRLIEIRRYMIDNEKPERSTLTFRTKETGTTVKLAEHFERFRWFDMFDPEAGEEES